MTKNIPNNSKKYCIFACRLTPTHVLAFAVLLFASNTAINAENIGYQFPKIAANTKTVIVGVKTEKGSLSSLSKFNINFSFMTPTMKNASGLKKSNPNAREKTCESGIKTPRLDLTGVRSNVYLYAIRKAFREFLLEESKGFICSEIRLTKKIEAAQLLFPEHRKELIHFIERRLFV